MSASVPHDDIYYMRRLVDHVPSMLAYWDHETRCRFANRAYLRWFGVAPEQLLGRPIRELLGPQLYALNEPHILGALRGEEQLFERVVPGPDGVLRHSLAHYLPDRVGDRVAGFLVQVTEVTQIKQMQAQLLHEQSLRQHLEHHARELGALLTERGEMLDVLAHEVRQPLNNASAALQGLDSALAAGDPRAIAAPVERARAVLRQVTESLDNTLAVASLLARLDPIEREDTDIDTLIAVACADLAAGDRGRVLVERATTTRTASMDMSLMRLALRNLLSNALKFSPPGSPVRLRIADSDEPLALVLEVSDAGPGVEPGLVPRLFQRGRRSRASGAPQGQGLGLGLFIVRRVMELHGGHAELLRTGPAGTTFRLLVVQPEG
ncbi:sensor histidine kinase [Piscinibacter defluvii]|uniref:sensor histidine kinase n=1 Tax=Piscinibacter defluvii TaxID=1796922 RepID=UPI000FDE4DE8|nr:PAS domain-containing sensor histidine kinase [Piscinibacter defluvii]